MTTELDTVQSVDMVKFAQDAVRSANPESIPALLNAMFDFQLKVRAFDSLTEFNRDFAAAKSQMPIVAKNGTIKMGEKGSIAFATYDDVSEAIRPIEENYGFVRSFETAPSKDGIMMTLVMRHRSGHVDRGSSVEMPPDSGPGRNGMQARRSASSYAKRGLTLDYWDIVTKGADNDANTAEPITQAQADAIRDLLVDMGSTPSDGKFLAWLKKHFGADSINRIQRHQFEQIMQGLEDRRKAR